MLRCLILGLILLGTPAAAQFVPPLPEGRVNAIVCGDVPATLVLDVVLLDNADANLPVKDSFVATLRGRGVRIAPGASLVLTLGIETVREAVNVKPPDLVDVQVGQANEDSARTEPGDTSIGEQGMTKVRANIWSNRRDSVLGGRRRVVEGQMVDQVKLSASLNRRADGRCLWQGDAVQELNGANAARAARTLAPFLAHSLGKSIRNRPLETLSGANGG
ncbi:MAG: hypothetical protein V3R85_05925 [Alphaproteobacteria bacterium]